MYITPPAIAKVIGEFNKLPGIGHKTSERFVYHLLRQPKRDLDELAESIRGLRDHIRVCTECCTYTDEEFCAICRDTRRNHRLLCVVAEPNDCMVIEKTGEFDGLYHVLGGVINHPEGVGPHQLRLRELRERVERHHVEEVIIATNPDMEGETTALYIAQQLRDLPNVRISKIARGLPMGADIEFADEVTLGNALIARQKI